jgi:hypothetical protein
MDGATITVHGDESATARVVFILDCSRSMLSNNRMVLAKKALHDVMDQMLRAKERYVVGLWAFGHRAWYPRANVPGDEQYSNYKKKKYPRDAIRPDYDVEQIAPLRLLTGEFRQFLENEIQQFEPWGYTPLYYSLEQCFDSLRSQNQPVDVIVITDGVDIPSRVLVTEEPKEDARRTREIVVAARDKNPNPDKPRIYVVGMDHRDLENDEQRGPRLKALRELAVRTDGEFFDANSFNRDDLFQKLQEVLDLPKYEVVPRGEIGGHDTSTSAGTPLGVSTRISPIGRSGSCVVQLTGGRYKLDVPVFFEGGENIELIYDKWNGKLRFPKYEPREARGEILRVRSEKHNKTFRVQAMLPRPVSLDRKVWEFYAYVQEETGEDRDEYLFTRRPQHVWAEIQPKHNGADIGPSYEFFDCDFVPDTPVPVFRFRAQNWPQQATSATIRLWFSAHPNDVTPNQTHVIDSSKLEEVTIRGLPGVSFRVRATPLSGEHSYRVKVTETHDSPTRVEPIRVQIYPPANRVVRRYFDGVSEIEHEFYYEEKQATEARFTSYSSVVENAIRVPELAVPLPER